MKTGGSLASVILTAALACACATAPRPALPTPRQVVEAKFDAVNRHATTEIAAHYAPDALLLATDFCAPRQGRAEVERTYRAIFDAVPDASVDVQEYVVEGDRVAVRFVVSGHVSGRAIAIPIMNFFTVQGGLITRDEGVFNNGARPCTP